MTENEFNQLESEVRHDTGSLPVGPGDRPPDRMIGRIRQVITFGKGPGG